MAPAVAQRMEVVGKSYLYLGSGDFSAPLAKAMKHAQVDPEKVNRFFDDDDELPQSPPTYVKTLNPGYKVVATELATRNDTLKAQNQYALGHKEQWEQYQTPLGNIYDLQSVGAVVIEGFDATQPFTALEEGEKFDRIIFQNPHTGVYGSKIHPGQDALCVESNKNLLEGVFQQAKSNLKPGGRLEIYIAGWPFKTNQSHKGGMNLDNGAFARGFGLRMGWNLVKITNKGQRRVRRNNGEYFYADVVKLAYTLQEEGL